jgi:hypothetical protein
MIDANGRCIIVKIAAAASEHLWLCTVVFSENPFLLFPNALQVVRHLA